MAITYVLPNLSTFTQRGGLEERSNEARKLNQKFNAADFKYLEFPGDFIKNPTEVRSTGLALGSMLTPSAVAKLYDSAVGDQFPYVLHTEPSLPRRGGNSSITPPLRWFDAHWRNEFLNHILSIIDFIGQQPGAIEVHPGSPQWRKNNIESFVEGLIHLKEGLMDHLSSCPPFFIENRTEHVISSGSTIQQFWGILKSTNKVSPSASIRVILDVQQLYTKTKIKFNQELAMIPVEALIGFHIHQLHRSPHLNGPIDWMTVRKLIHRAIRHSTLFILPEVHHHTQLVDTYRFCKDFLRL